MNSEDVLVPATGSDGEMEVIEISVSAGDVIEHDQTIIVLESDKATVEVPSPKSGKVDSVQVSVGDKVKEGTLLIKLVASDNDLKESSEKADEKPEKNTTSNKEVIPEKIHTASSNDNDAVRIKKVVVPDLGGSEQVEVIEVIGSIGDLIEEEQTLIVLETDKATMEIPCPVSGSLALFKVKVGDKVSTGDIIAEVILKSAGLSNALAVVDKKNEIKTEAASSQVSSKEQNKESVISQNMSKKSTSFSADSVHAGPSVRKFSREHGVDLTQVKPSGPRERILVDDVSAYIKSQVLLAQSGVTSAGYIGPSVSSLPDFKQFGEVSISSMSKIHFMTAENMQRNWSVPHVTQFDEVDITEMESFRVAQKAAAELKGFKVTPIVFMLKACAYVLKALPQFNVALDLTQKQIIQKHFIHIGFAVDTPHGLFVPVVRDVDKKGIWELAAECQDLASKARDRKLKPADMQGGCFTISSLGAIGGTAFTPIVNAPEVAILGVSKAQMRPVYASGNKFEARLMLPLSLSYDHRAVNGADGARFTTLLAKVLGDIRELLL
ncbi:MAG: pyruvate dehydrogenase E2 component (dihydrolipoamide acetyltransferase) [Oleiphilaceae bacterium]|jgi:pyruvate dehydrogenase E2 component (dihydrolipoamide acetyltransferase)